MFICICNAVTDKQILEAKAEGYTSMRQIHQKLGVGNCCGRCVPEAKAVLKGASSVQKYIPNNFAQDNLVPA
ncbi:(2Fe-2S)-binding protein [Aliikangiella sp. IMCC44653]